MADGRNPRDVKFELAREIVTRFHDHEAAERAQANFSARFSQRTLPADLPLVTLPTDGEDVGLIGALTGAGLAASGAEARRKIAEGAVRLDGEKVSDVALRLKAGAIYVLQVGQRRAARVQIQKN